MNTEYFKSVGKSGAVISHYCQDLFSENKLLK